MRLEQFDPLSKISFHPEWLDAYRRGERVPPLSVEMDLTNRCNYDCPNCVWGSYIKSNRAHLSPEAALRQIHELASAGVKAVILSGGGEPLLNPVAPEAMRLAKSLGLRVGLFTNGVMMMAAVRESLVECCDWVRVHLDGATPESYARRHALNASLFERVRRNLSDLSALRDACRSELEIGIGSVINRHNLDDIPLLAELAFNSGCEYWQAKHDFELLSRADYTAWWTSAVVPILEELERRYAQANFSIQFTTTDYGRKPEAMICHIHHLATAVNAEGRVAYCKRLRDRPDWSAGNLHGESLTAIIEGDRNTELSASVTPQNCGIACPYIELNESIDRVSSIIRGRASRGRG